MADGNGGSRAKWLWIIVLALLAVLLLVWLLNPSGNEDDGSVDDPITTPDLTQPTTTGADTLEQPLVPGEGTTLQTPTDPAATPDETTTATEPAPLETPE